MINVGIIGARGYVGGELVRILANHPDVELTYLTSENYSGKPITEVFPGLMGVVDGLVYEAFNPRTAADKTDIMFFALPEGEAMAYIPSVLRLGKRVVDISGDFRIKNPETYKTWYARDHVAVDYLKKAVYGIPELHSEDIALADLVANPGCYPISSVLAAAPLVMNRMVHPQSIIFDAKSGVSGAGGRASMSPDYSYTAVNEGMKAYGLGMHRHTPEIEQELNRISGEEHIVSFTPHLIPMNRGILTTVYGKLFSPMNTIDMIELYQEFYADCPFVHILGEGVLPQTKYVSGSNYCHIGMKVDKRAGRIIVVSVIDNLVKGAAGNAIQNMNIMVGNNETAGLKFGAVYP